MKGSSAGTSLTWSWPSTMAASLRTSSSRAPSCCAGGSPARRSASAGGAGCAVAAARRATGTTPASIAGGVDPGCSCSGTSTASSRRTHLSNRRSPSRASSGRSPVRWIRRAAASSSPPASARSPTAPRPATRRQPPPRGQHQRRGRRSPPRTACPGLPIMPAADESTTKFPRSSSSRCSAPSTFERMARHPLWGRLTDQPSSAAPAACTTAVSGRRDEPGHHAGQLPGRPRRTRPPRPRARRGQFVCQLGHRPVAGSRADQQQVPCPVRADQVRGRRPAQATGTTRRDGPVGVEQGCPSDPAPLSGPTPAVSKSAPTGAAVSGSARTSLGTSPVPSRIANCSASPPSSAGRPAGWPATRRCRPARRVRAAPPGRRAPGPTPRRARARPRRRAPPRPHRRSRDEPGGGRTTHWPASSAAARRPG